MKKKILPVLLAMILISACNKTDERINIFDDEEIVVLQPTLDSITAKINSPILDSLLTLTANVPADKGLVRLLFTIGEEYENAAEYDAALHYYTKGLKLAQDLKFWLGYYAYAASLNDIDNKAGRYEQSLERMTKVINLVSSMEPVDNFVLTQCNSSLGLYYSNKGYYETALTYYIDALNNSEELGDTALIGTMCDMIQVLYYNMDMPQKGVEYGKRAVELLQNHRRYMSALLNLYCNYTHSLIRNYEKGEIIIRQMLEIAKQQHHTTFIALANHNLADLYIHTNRYNEARQLLEFSLSTFRSMSYHKGICGALEGLSYVEFYNNNFAKAEQIALQAFDIAQEYELHVHLKRTTNILADIAMVKHNFEKMNKWRAMNDSIENILTSDQLKRAQEELHVKYETEKKELKITNLEKEKQLIKWLSVAGGSVLLLGLAAFFFMWRYSMQKKRFAETRIIQLEQEKQLVATQSVLDGELQERTRLARDLHDGLGSMLTGVKFNLESLKNSVSLNTDDVHHFDKAMNILNNSMREMRRVAHHLMPDALSRYGLKAALKDFCDNFPSIKFVWFGNDTRLDDRKKEVMIYRIIHELINNALKHSGATEIGLNVMHETDYIALTVFDNGCGFDASAECKGMGLSNIRKRVASCEGRMEVDSNRGKGTEINVEFRLDS